MGMQDRAIKFQHYLRVSGKEIEMDELFVPYTKETLLSLVADSKRKEEWAKLLSEDNSFDEEKECECYEYFYPEQNNNNWVDDGSNYISESLWDYLSEVNTVCNIYNTFQNERNPQELKTSGNIKLVEKLAHVNLLSRICYDMVKIDLSVLVNSADSIGDSELESKIVEYYNYIHEKLECKKTGNEGDLEEEKFDILWQYGNLRRLTEDINSVVRVLENNNETAVFDAVEMIIRRKFNSMLYAAGRVYALRKRFLVQINDVYRLGMKEEQIYRMAISSEHYNKNRVNMFNKIMQAFMSNKNIIPSIYDSDFEIIFKKLCEFFENIIKIEGKTTVGKEILGRYKDDDGCFAILKEVGGDTYFAFSNVLEYEEDAKRTHFEVLAKEVFDKVFGISVKIEDVRTHGGDVNWAYLTGETKRYFTFGAWKEEQGDYENPTTLDEDIVRRSLIWNRDKGQIGTAYGCCERKILRFCESDTMKILFSRWVPCFKCRPAVFNEKIKIYALNKDFKEWKEKRNCMLKEYKVKIKYGVEEIRSY